MDEIDTLYELLERGTALAIPLLALLGVFRRVHRLDGLNRIILPEPVEQEDVDYLASVKRSTYLRLGVKCVLLLGGLIMLFHLTDYLLFWRFGVITILVLMDFETVNVDAVRQRLALSARAKSDEQSQRDRIEATGQDTNERIRRGDIGRGETALVDRAQADRIENTGDETADRLRREGIGDQQS